MFTTLPALPGPGRRGKPTAMSDVVLEPWASSAELVVFMVSVDFRESAGEEVSLRGVSVELLALL